MINEYELFGKSKKEFEELFITEDPWMLSYNVEQLRYKLTLVEINKNSEPKKDNILELGCAEGNFTELLSSSGYNVTAVDISENAIIRAKKKNIKNANFIVDDMLSYVKNENLNDFNIILLVESLCYLKNDKRMELLKNISEKINFDTCVYFSLPVKKNDVMFPSKKEIINLFRINNFKLYSKSKVVSLIGINGRVSAKIKYLWFVKCFIYLHKILFPYRLNQQLFSFKKVIPKEL